MSFMQALSDFFKSLFMSNSPDVQKRQIVRKIENELKQIAPTLYKNGLVQANFAETLRVLYHSTKSIDSVLSETLCSDMNERNKRFEEQLMMTGFDAEAQEILVNMEYEKRKVRARESQSLTRFFDSEHRQLEKVVKQLNTDNFFRIDKVLDRLKQLNDICRFGYVQNLRLFDANFSSSESYQPDFQSLPADILETTFLDLYYVLADMDVTSSVANAVIALYRLKSRGEASSRAVTKITEDLRKIQGIIKHVFTKHTLLWLIRLAKKDPEYMPEQAAYAGRYRQVYAEYLEKRFRVDENRLKGELQDENISSSVQELFEGYNLLSSPGYNQEINNQLKQSTPCSFEWVLPLQVLKTFVEVFYEISVKALLNDIVIEGFFNTPAYKSEFSAAVFACNEIKERLEKFEHRFTRNEEFDEANITGLIHDSHKDAAFIGRLQDLVGKINSETKAVIQAETTNLNTLYKKLGDIINEAKKPSSDMITNLKVLMISSRNRDSAEKLESQYALWKVFLDIMKNYVIIGTIEKKSR